MGKLQAVSFPGKNLSFEGSCGLLGVSCGSQKAEPERGGCLNSCLGAASLLQTAKLPLAPFTFQLTASVPGGPGRL